MQAEGAYTKLGTWAPTETDAEVIEMMADKDEEWEESLKGKGEWLNRPAQPPGLLRTGGRTLPCQRLLSTLIGVCATIVPYQCEQRRGKGGLTSERYAYEGRGMCDTIKQSLAR